MNPEIKTRWTAALRSEDFKQGRKRLASKKSPDSPMMHCCLGVLCELAVEDGIIEARNKPYGDETIREFGRDDAFAGWSAGQLPIEVAGWAGFVSGPNSNVCDPTLTTIPDTLTEGEDSEGRLYYVSCSEVNDGYNYRSITPKSFSQIADLIDERF